MTPDLEITCITKINRYDPHDHIQTVGGIEANGTSWRFSLDDAIEALETGRCHFHTGSGWTYARVVVASRNGRKYLTTQVDDIQQNNLLNLPDCFVVYPFP